MANDFYYAPHPHEQEMYKAQGSAKPPHFSVILHASYLESMPIY
jgi:hypothetical protein